MSFSSSFFFFFFIFFFIFFSCLLLRVFLSFFFSALLLLRLFLHFFPFQVDDKRTISIQIQSHIESKLKLNFYKLKSKTQKSESVTCKWVLAATIKILKIWRPKPELFASLMSLQNHPTHRWFSRAIHCTNNQSTQQSQAKALS